MPRAKDEELLAIRRITEILTSLPDNARGRVITYIQARFPELFAKAVQPSTPTSGGR